MVQEQEQEQEQEVESEASSQIYASRNLGGVVAWHWPRAIAYFGVLAYQLASRQGDASLPVLPYEFVYLQDIKLPLSEQSHSERSISGSSFPGSIIATRNFCPFTVQAPKVLKSSHVILQLGLQTARAAYGPITCLLSLREAESLYRVLQTLRWSSCVGRAHSDFAVKPVQDCSFTVHLVDLSNKPVYSSSLCLSVGPSNGAAIEGPHGRLAYEAPDLRVPPLDVAWQKALALTKFFDGETQLPAECVAEVLQSFNEAVIVRTGADGEETIKGSQARRLFFEASLNLRRRDQHDWRGTPAAGLFASADYEEWQLLETMADRIIRSLRVEYDSLERAFEVWDVDGDNMLSQTVRVPFVSPSLTVSYTTLTLPLPFGICFHRN